MRKCARWESLSSGMRWAIHDGYRLKREHRRVVKGHRRRHSDQCHLRQADHLCHADDLSRRAVLILAQTTGIRLGQHPPTHRCDNHRDDDGAAPDYHSHSWIPSPQNQRDSRHDAQDAQHDRRDDALNASAKDVHPVRIAIPQQVPLQREADRRSALRTAPLGRQPAQVVPALSTRRILRNGRRRRWHWWRESLFAHR